MMQSYEVSNTNREHKNPINRYLTEIL